LNILNGLNACDVAAMQVELRRSLMAEALIKDRIRATIK